MAVKSRLVCRGYEQHRDEDEQVYAATPSPASLRALLCVAQLRGLTVAVGDCSDAFLQAPLEGDGEVWVKPPPEAECMPGHAWLLKKTLPGLRCGPASWGATPRVGRSSFTTLRLRSGIRACTAAVRTTSGRCGTWMTTCSSASALACRS